MMNQRNFRLKMNSKYSETGERRASQNKTKYMREFTGKAVLITAASAGIGLETAKRFCEEGAKVFITSRKEENLKKAVEIIRSTVRGEYEIEYSVGHSGIPEDVKNVVDLCWRRFGKIDILVNNAATNPTILPLHEIDDDLWNKIISVSLTGNFIASREVARRMIQSGIKGSIINVSSVAGMRATPGLGAYAAAKAALISITKTMAVELAPFGIRVNAVAPGIIRTKFSKVLVDMFEAGAAADNPLLKIPLGKVGETKDVAELILFLASDRSSYITGSVFVVDGGSTA